MFAQATPPPAIARSVATAALLSAVSDSGLPEGEPAFVQSFLDSFVLSKTSVDTVDSLSVVATQSGIGRWLRRNVAHPTWIRQATWFIDPVSGNDENTGIDLAHALRTDAERQRRWGTIAYINTSVTLTVVSLPSTDPLNGEIRLLAGGKFVLQGTATVTRTSTLTAVTAINRAGAQPLHVTDGAFDWTSSVGSQVLITSGARSGAKTFVAKAVSAGIGRLGNLLLPPVVEWDLPTKVTPVSADPYQIRTLPTVYVGNFRVMNANDVSLGSTSNTLYVIDVKLVGMTGIKGTWETAGVAGHFIGVSFLNMNLIGDGNCTQCSCYFSGTRINGGFVAGGVSSGFGLSCVGANTTYLDYDFLCQGGPVIYTFYGALCQAANVCSMDATSGAIVGVLSRAVLQHVGASPGASFWGVTTSGRALVLESAAQFVYSVAAAITINVGLGLGREVLVGPTDKLFSALPYVDATKQAFAVTT